MSLNCLTCGACCVGLVVDVLDTDPTPKRMTTKEPDGTRIMRAKKGRDIGQGPCIALEGEVGQACSCKIYDKRPWVCREFIVGNFSCQIARRAQKVREVK